MKTRIRATAVLVGLPASWPAACRRAPRPRPAAPSRHCRPPTTRCATYARRRLPGMPGAWRCGSCRGRRRRARTRIRWGSRSTTGPAAQGRRSLRTPHARGRQLCLRPEPAQRLRAADDAPPPPPRRSRSSMPTTTSTAEADLKRLRRRIWRLPRMHRNSERMLHEGRPERRNRKPALSASNAARTAEEAICKTAISRRNEGSSLQGSRRSRGWAEEISLDIEVAHAICQNCKIVLVEANSTVDTISKPPRKRPSSSAPPRSRTRGAAPMLKGPWHRMRRRQRSLRPSRHRDHGRRRRRRLPGLGRRRKLGTGLRRLPRLLPTRGRGRRHPPEARLPGGLGRTRRCGMATAPAEAAAATTLTAPTWQQSRADWSSVGCGTTPCRRRCLGRC